MSQETPIDYSKDSLLTSTAIDILKDRYLLPSETSPQDGYYRACTAFGSNKEHTDRLYSYVSNQWFMFASPLLSNGGTEKGLPISCFLSDVQDSIESLAHNINENIFLSVLGGGIGNNFSKVRSINTSISKGGKTPGVIPFIGVIDKLMAAYMQGSSRRGSAAIYLDISHPEIEEFIEIRDHLNGDRKRRCLNEGFHHAVNIPDSFMVAVTEDLMWDLIDPHTKEVVSQVKARELWSKLLTMRMQKGEPYIHFIDTSNAALCPELKEKGLRVNSSNLCAEILLPTDANRTAVCCLSSLNLEKYEEWKNNALFITDILEMLDNALEDFIRKAPQEIKNAAYSASMERSVGLGTMGWHSLLQSKGIPFESQEARELNISIFSWLKKTCDQVNQHLGRSRGSPPDLQGSGKRFAHMLAIAPNASSSIVCSNVSPSIEPYNANIYTQDTTSGTSVVKNKWLDALLDKSLGINKKEVWHSILMNKGSVQHLDFLTVREKATFKTAMEIDQEWVIRHAADRQPFICQGQSVNLFMDPRSSFSTIHKIHKMAWDLGLKTLYYCRSESVAKARHKDQIVEEVKPKRNSTISCVGCEG